MSTPYPGLPLGGKAPRGRVVGQEEPEYFYESQSFLIPYGTIVSPLTLGASAIVGGPFDPMRFANFLLVNEPGTVDVNLAITDSRGAVRNYPVPQDTQLILKKSYLRQFSITGDGASIYGQASWPEEASYSTYPSLPPGGSGGAVETVGMPNQGGDYCGPNTTPGYSGWGQIYVQAAVLYAGNGVAMGISSISLAQAIANAVANWAAGIFVGTLGASGAAYFGVYVNGALYYAFATGGASSPAGTMWIYT